MTHGASKKPNYAVKDVELVVAGTDVQARVMTLAAGESIPWHYHSETTDHYFVLRGSLTITTRNPDREHELRPGDRHRIVPGTAHRLANRTTPDCQFLLLQGVGKYDWIKAEVRTSAAQRNPIRRAEIYRDAHARPERPVHKAESLNAPAGRRTAVA